MSTDGPVADTDLVDEGDELGQGDHPPDESTLMGVLGVQAEVEAAAARAEAELDEEDDGTDAEASRSE